MTGHCPTINGQKPNEEFDLDNKSHLAALGYQQKNDGERADKYVHYPHCDWAVIEWKGSAIPKAIRQIEATIEMLVQLGRKVDLVFVIKKRINRFEQRAYKRSDDKILIDPQTREPYTVKVGTKKLNVFLLYQSEEHSNNMLDDYFSKGVN